MNLKQTMTALLLVMAGSVSAYDFSATNKFVNEYEMVTEIELYYAFNEDGKSVSVVQGPETYNLPYVTIPDKVTYDGKEYTVTMIGYRAFQDASMVTLVMSDNIVEVKSEAFSGCSVANATMSKGLKRIGDYAFWNTQIGTVELSEGLERMGEWAFSSYPGSGYLTIVHLPESLKEIGEGAFSSCHGLTDINIPVGVKQIKDLTFDNCYALKEIVLPEGLESIGNSAFYATGIEEINFPSTLKEIGVKSFFATKLKTVSLPDNIVAVGECAFYGCRELQEITFSTGMAELPKEIVSGCDHLVKVNIPDVITKIGYSAFSQCERLSSITLPESVVEVESYVFNGSGIQTIHLPSKLTYIGDGMFMSCKNLQSFKIPSTITEIKDFAFQGCDNLTEVTIPETVTAIGSDAFGGTGLREATIPAGVATVDFFRDCKQLEKVTLPEGVTKIVSFSGCESLVDINIPQSVNVIETWAFQGCTSLRSITLPRKLEALGTSSFYDCTNLEELHINRAIPPLLYWHGEFIHENSQCVLCVPKGSKATYEATGQYFNFKAIVEEDVDGTVTYQVETMVAEGGGSIQVNGVYDWRQKYEVEIDNDAVLSLNPEEGYHLQKLTVNGMDVTQEMDGNTYTIKAIKQNYVVEAEFAENPVKLSVATGNGGCVAVSVQKGERYECQIVVEDGWRINTVLFNSVDVTSEVSDNVYLTPALYSDASIVVSFEQAGASVRSVGGYSNQKVYATVDGKLHIEATTPGESVRVYDADGMTVATLTASGSTLTYSLPTHGVYIVKTSLKSVKVSY